MKKKCRCAFAAFFRWYFLNTITTQKYSQPFTGTKTISHPKHCLAYVLMDCPEVELISQQFKLFDLVPEFHILWGSRI